jgi:rhamnose utilization protein RhaD (predicted bifunctional aldolase and dehydrogenase)
MIDYPMPNSSYTKPQELPELRAMSRRIGSDLTLVQGSGGNTSITDGNVLWVKASGTWLINAESQDILVPVDLPMVRRILDEGGSDFNAATLEGDLRPSIETSLHCQLSHHIVTHVHSVNAIAWNVQVGARERLGELLSGIDWRYVPYAKPGASLTAEVARVLAAEPGDPALLVLENHGLVLGGENCADVEKLIAEVESLLELEERSTRVPNISELSVAIEDVPGWRVPTFADIHAIALDEGAINVATGGVLIPDHAVFLERAVPVCDSVSDVPATFQRYRSKFGNDPDWMIVRGAGVILSQNIGNAGEDQLRGLAMIALRISTGAQIRYIDQSAAEDLRSWDAEIYRKKLDEESSGKNGS